MDRDAKSIVVCAKAKKAGPTEIRTRVGGIRIRSDNQLHYRTALIFAKNCKIYNPIYITYTIHKTLIYPIFSFIFIK